MIGLFEILSIVLFLNVTIGLFVYIRAHYSRASFFFFLLALSSALWIGGVSILYYPDVIRVSQLLGGRITFFGASLMGGAMVLFAYEFPRRTITGFITSQLRYLLLLLAALFAFLSLATPLVVRNIVAVTNPLIIGYGPLYPFFGMFFLVTAVVTISFLWLKYRYAGGIERFQLQYFFIGFFLAVLFGVTTNLFVPLVTGESRYSAFGPLASFFVIGATAYAVIKHHLLEIRIIFAEIFSGFVLLILFIGVITSRTFPEFILNVVTFGVVALFSYLNIRRTFHESEDKFRIEHLLKELTKVNDRLKRLDQLRSDFISIATHQIRTPLTVTKGYIAELKSSTFYSANVANELLIDRMNKNNERLIRLVDDLLDMSRIERGKLEYDFKPFPVEELLESVVEEMNLEAAKKNLYLDFKKVETSLPKISCDPDKLHQAFINLVENAIKYTPEGGITVSHSMSDTAVVIKISDTGIGLTPEEIKTIFGKFKRGMAKGTEGLGLGLYLVKSIITAHGGKIKAESVGKHKGSTFTIELPLTPKKIIEKR